MVRGVVVFVACLDAVVLVAERLPVAFVTGDAPRGNACVPSAMPCRSLDCLPTVALPDEVSDASRSTWCRKEPGLHSRGVGMGCSVLLAYCSPSREGSCSDPFRGSKNNSPHILSWERPFCGYRFQKILKKKIKTGLDKIRSQNGGSSKQSLIAIPNMGKAHSQLSQGSPFFPKCPYADTVL